jgi:NitT/TauT family transport system permease protein
MASVLSIVGALVGEFVGAQRGLGTLILSMDAQMDMGGTFSIFIILSILGVVMHWGLTTVRKRVLFWSGEVNRNRMQA